MSEQGSEGTRQRAATGGPAYGMGTTVALPYERAVERTREALGAEGFGVLSEIDVSATLKKKLDVDFRPYVILGACNPPLAFSAINADPSVGLLLPCNVTVESVSEQRTIVRLTNPEALLATGPVGASPELASVARDAGERMARVANTLKQTNGVGGD